MDVLVVGGGISGLATAYAIEREAERRNIAVNVQVIEAEQRLGGKIESRQKDGFVIEASVNGWLDSKPTTEALCRSLGIYDERLVSNDAARRRFIYSNHALQALPESPGAFFASRVLSWGGKLRLFCEPWAKLPPPGDETVADFVRRRLGQEALDILLDPMVSGVYAGDPKQLSMKSAFPRIVEIERTYGGLIRGLLKIQKERAKERKAGKDVAKVGPAPSGKLVSFAPGTERLVQALSASLKNRPMVGRRVASIEKTAGGFCVIMEDQSKITSERLVLATPAWAASRIVEGLDGDLSRELSSIVYAAASVVALAWRTSDMPHNLNGFGFLIPSREGRKILGTLWDSSAFRSRAPEGYVLTRSIIGGMRRFDLAMQSKADLVKSAREELKTILGVTKEPYLVDVAQHLRAIPQYTPGHASRLTRIAERVAHHAGLVLTGNAYRGVGINDCTAAALDAAVRVLGE